MAVKSILSANQKKLLAVISENQEICRSFYLTGGTALAEYHLQHRLSEDLDFFSEQEVEPQSIYIFLKSIAKKCNLKKIDSQSSFNRNLFFLYLIDDDIIKTEFTYYPFPRIEKKIKIGSLFVDSILDIAVNKLFTIYQKPRSRDFIDLYLIVKKEKLTIAELVKKAKIKFDWHIDYLQLAGQFCQATEVKDYPKMMIKLDDAVWHDYFISEAKKLKTNILK